MKRIILIFSGALSALSVILTAFFIHLAVYRGFAEKVKQEAAVELEYVRAGVELAGPAYLETLRTRFPRLTLIAANGTVLYDTETDGGTLENHRSRPEFQAALVLGLGESRRYSSTLGKSTYYRALRLKDGAVLRIAASSDSILASTLSILPLTLGIVLAICAAGLVAAASLTKRIVDPINRINLEQIEDNMVYDELAPLLERIKKQKDEIARRMEELREKHLEFQAITDTMGEGLLVLDREGRILSCNQSALSLLGFKEKGFPALPAVKTPGAEGSTVLALCRDSPFRGAVEQSLAGTSAETVLGIGQRRIRLFANPVGTAGEAGGVQQGAVLLLMDITEREDRERLRREFSANVSHELKTPLTVISGYGEIIANGLAKGVDCPGFGAKIYEEAQRLISLINDIMLLSRLDEGADLNRETLDLLVPAKEALRRTAQSAKKRNITITLEGESLAISGIPRVLEEMIFNLLDNAVKYNRDNGNVGVTIFRDGNMAVLSVSDTGIGIPPGEQDRIFERFYRVDKIRGGRPGTGLGLSIVKHGALLHNAKIEVESGEGGTTIRVRFRLI
jgi:two-component system phosphate regulon sensor histidine kinase PhoR